MIFLISIFSSPLDSKSLTSNALLTHFDLTHFLDSCVIFRKKKNIPLVHNAHPSLVGAKGQEEWACHELQCAFQMKK